MIVIYKNYKKSDPKVTHSRLVHFYIRLSRQAGTPSLFADGRTLMVQVSGRGFKLWFHPTKTEEIDDERLGILW